MIKKLLLAALIAMPTMPEMAQARTQLEASSKKYQEEFNKLQETFQKSYEEYQKLEQDATTPQTIKDRRVQELQEMQSKIQQFRETVSQDLEKQQQQLMAPIQQKVADAIKGVGASGSYTMIFENVLPLYTGSDVEDITPQVKSRLGLK